MKKIIIHRCYVCGQLIQKSKELYIGSGLYRHTSCEAGSKKWLSSPIGHRSPLRQYFIKEEENARDPDKN